MGHANSLPRYRTPASSLQLRFEVWSTEAAKGPRESCSWGVSWRRTWLQMRKQLQTNLGCGWLALISPALFRAADCTLLACSNRDTSTARRRALVCQPALGCCPATRTKCLWCCKSVGVVHLISVHTEGRVQSSQFSVAVMAAARSSRRGHRRRPLLLVQLAARRRRRAPGAAALLLLAHQEGGGVDGHALGGIVRPGAEWVGWGGGPQT